MKGLRTFAAGLRLHFDAGCRRGQTSVGVGVGDGALTQRLSLLARGLLHGCNDNVQSISCTSTSKDQEAKSSIVFYAKLIKSDCR